MTTPSTKPRVDYPRHSIFTLTNEGGDGLAGFDVYVSAMDLEEVCLTDSTSLTAKQTSTIDKISERLTKVRIGHLNPKDWIVIEAVCTRRYSYAEFQVVQEGFELVDWKRPKKRFRTFRAIRDRLANLEIRGAFAWGLFLFFTVLAALWLQNNWELLSK